MIDPSLMKHLTPELATRMRAFEEMFNTKGWQFLKELLEQQRQSAEIRTLNAQSWSDNRVAYGQLGVLAQMVAIEDTFAAEFEAAAEAQRTAQEDQQIAEEVEYE